MTVRFFTGWDTLQNTVSANIEAELLAKGHVFIKGTNGGTFARETGRNGVGYAIRLSTGSSSGGIRVRLSESDIANMAQGSVGVVCKQLEGSAAYSGSVFRLTDTAGSVLSLAGTGSPTTLLLSYNPTGTTNDITQNVVVPIPLTEFSFYELRWTSSLIELAVNNQVVYTKVQTAQAAFNLVETGITGISSIIVDDCYLADDANFRQDFYCRPLALTSTVSNTGTVTGAADAHTALSSFDGDTSYVSYTADAQKTMLGLADITDNPVTIHAVTLARSACKSDTGSTSESLLITTASEQVVGGNFAGLALPYSGRRVVAATDPHDSSAWTKAKVNSMQAGVKRGA